VNPLVLVPPQKHKPFKLYLSAHERVIGSALIQEVEGKERVIYYISRRLLDEETMYSLVERLCLCLYFLCTKLRYYFLSAECIVVCKDDVVKHMLSLPILNGKIGKWILALSEFDLRYESAKAVKGMFGRFRYSSLWSKCFYYGACSMDFVFRWVILWECLWYRCHSHIASGGKL
jgi:hypothetical protein